MLPVRFSLPMATLEQVVQRQAVGARFVISATLLGMPIEAFDMLVQTWLDGRGPGFTMAAVPHRKYVDGKFFIDRITVTRSK
ncbi:MAG: hypothetical protein NVSMB6_04290 [Burkholderiaceae bacterium]